MHELSARGNDVRVKFEPSYVLLFKSDFVSPLCLDVGLTIRVVLGIARGSETTSSLLVHFCSGRDSVNRKINELLRPHDADNFVGVLVDIFKNLLL